MNIVVTPKPAIDKSEILNSWKEIAQYLNRGVRTVQRWEEELQLPVRRLRPSGRSPVIARRSEIDLWLKNCSFENGKAVNGNAPVKMAVLCASSRELRSESRQLRFAAARSRAQLASSIVELMATLEKMMAPPPRQMM